MSRKVKDVMTAEVAYVSQDTPYKELVQLLVTQRVSAVPVVDDRRHVVGIVSEADLLLKPQEPADHFQRFMLEGKQRRLERVKAKGATAAELMTRPVITVSPDTGVAEAARLLRKHLVKRLPVVDPLGRLVGIISRADVLKLYLRPDKEIRREILDEVILGDLVMGPNRFDVDVRDGVVTLQGRCERRNLIPVLVRAVASVEGVVRVENRLGYDSDNLSSPLATLGARLP